MHVIDSLQNPLVKECIRLRKKRGRSSTARFLIDGEREVMRALTVGGWIEKVLLQVGKENQCSVIYQLTKQNGIPVVWLSEKTFGKIAYREHPDGVIAIAKYREKNLQQLSVQLKENGLFLVCVGIEKPGNLGAMLRSADGAGVQGVILCETHIDVLHANTIRSSTGVVFSLPVYHGGTSRDVIVCLQSHGYKIIATTPEASSTYTNIAYGARTAVVVGKEQVGLSDDWIASADHTVKIPMLGTADSLNVAHTAALVLYEVVRQHARS